MEPSETSRPVRENRTEVQIASDEETNSSQDRTENDSRYSLRPRATAGVKRSYREVSDQAIDTDSMEIDQVESHDAPTAAVNRSMQDLTVEAASHTPGTPQRKLAKRPRVAEPSGMDQTTTPRPNVVDRVIAGAQPGFYSRDSSPEQPDHFVGPKGIPPWHTLPYHVWFDIFLRASYPLVDVTSYRTPSVQWLVRLACLCQAFREPALAALYHSPPLLPAPKTHKLVDLLSEPETSLSMNYAVKVKELHVDVEKLLLLKSGPTLGYFSLPNMVTNTPQLRVLRLYHHEDSTLGIPSWNISLSRFRYPEALFSSLQNNGVTLRSWDWNARFLETNKLIALMSRLHGCSVFAGLKELRLLHIQRGARDNAATQAANETALAATIRTLSKIERLELRECTLLGDTLLPQLPFTVRALVLSGCDQLRSPHLTSFLSSHGHHLQELTLESNRHLNLSFITSLGSDCPGLEKFRMDIQIHDKSAFPDFHPHFDELLKVTEKPTWPASLQELDLIQLRRWDVPAAEVFFKSLVDAGPRMPRLRRLNISAMLTVGWRDRANFRERWIAEIERVFRRHWGYTLREPSLCPPQSSAPGLPGDPAPLEGKIQGMCDEVNVRIDSLRPSETQFNEDDFLDRELSDDEDWQGDE